MKTLLRFILLFVLLFGTVVPASATIKSVTTVGATAVTILTVAPQATFVLIQNNGAGDVRISIDGGSVSNIGGSDPTSTNGMLLKAGTQISFTYYPQQRRPVIRAILVSGTTTILDIVTDDIQST